MGTSFESANPVKFTPTSVYFCVNSIVVYPTTSDSTTADKGAFLCGVAKEKRHPGGCLLVWAGWAAQRRRPRSATTLR